MKSLQRLLSRIQAGFTPALLIVFLSVLSCSLLLAEETKPKKETAAPPPASPAPTASPPKKAQKKPEKKLTGAELYALNCNRCHPERYAAERTAEQWQTILLHMRTRANLPAEQARAILHYLQEDSGK